MQSVSSLRVNVKFVFYLLYCVNMTDATELTTYVTGVSQDDMTVDEGSLTKQSLWILWNQVFKLAWLFRDVDSDNLFPSCVLVRLHIEQLPVISKAVTCE